MMTRCHTNDISDSSSSDFSVDSSSSSEFAQAPPVKMTRRQIAMDLQATLLPSNSGMADNRKPVSMKNSSFHSDQVTEERDIINDLKQNSKNFQMMRVIVRKTMTMKKKRFRRIRHGLPTITFDMINHIPPCKEAIRESLVPIGHMKSPRDYHVVVGNIGWHSKPIENKCYLDLLQDFEEEETECKGMILEKKYFCKNLLYILCVIMEFQFVKEDTLTHSLYEIGDKEVLEMLSMRYSSLTKKRSERTLYRQAIEQRPLIPEATNDSNDSQSVLYEDEEPFFGNFLDNY
eukprot:scaffold7969_cov56-Attheya_sp.AAC.9